MSGPSLILPSAQSRAQVRRDNRPEAYDIPGGSESVCIACLADKPPKTVRYPRKQVFMVNPHDNPTNSGVECFLCLEHVRLFLPSVVIVDPENGFECRDLSGRTWREME